MDVGDLIGANNLKRHLVIVDFEATCWEDAPKLQGEREIIEIGAVKIDAISLAEAGFFQSFVRPARHPHLSDFCVQLTHITQKQVDAAPRFPRALSRFVEWIGDPAEMLFCSWGEYDREQLRQDCAFHQLPYPFADAHVNLKQAFSHYRSGKPIGVHRALKALGMNFEGTLHRGLDDARNIARIYRRMHADGYWIDDSRLAIWICDE